MIEPVARRILEAAIREGRCAELIDCLFDDGSATVDVEGRLMLASAADLAAMLDEDAP